MSELEKYGITDDIGHASIRQPGGYLPVQEFFDHARELLPSLGESLRSEIIPDLETKNGRWHPSGYMVYPLGTHAVLGSLRFHIWPQGLRHQEHREGQPRDVHDHVVHIASTAIKGTYRDKIYRVEAYGQDMSDEEVTAKGLLRVFSPPYDRSGSEALTTDGRVVTASEIDQRAVPENEHHTIEVGVFHAPAIPDDQIAATLSFSSPRVGLAGPHILMGGPSEPIIGKNIPVSREEADSVKHQLM